MKSLSIASFLMLVIGGAVGFLSNIFISRVKQRHEIRVKILDQYFQARKDLCDKISIIANLKSSYDIDKIPIDEIRDNLSSMCYLYYDILPDRVLKELYCLHACLNYHGKNLFVCDNNRILRVKNDQMHEFIKRSSLVDNFTYFMPIALKSKNENLRKSVVLNCQARMFFKVLNEDFSLNKLMSLSNDLRKNYIPYKVENSSSLLQYGQTILGKVRSRE